MSESSAYLKPEVLARITKLGLRAQRVVVGSLAGLHRSPLHGRSAEFLKYRDYNPGDDLKHLDWRAYGRSGRYYIKQFEEDSNLRAALVVDSSASMTYGRKGTLTKFDYAATIAASLAMLLIGQRDAVGLSLVDKNPRAFLPPVATFSHCNKIIDALEKAKPQGETDLGAALVHVAEQISSRGVVFILSDLLTNLDSFYNGLARLNFRGHEVVVLHVLDPDEMNLPFDGSVIFKDIEGEEKISAEPWYFQKAYRAAMLQFCNDAEKRCRSHGVDYLRLTTDMDLGVVLSHYLAKRQIIRGVRRHVITAGPVAAEAASHPFDHHTTPAPTPSAEH